MGTTDFCTAFPRSVGAPRRGQIRQPRATPWASDSTMFSALNGRDLCELRPFRAMDQYNVTFPRRCLGLSPFAPSGPPWPTFDESRYYASVTSVQKSAVGPHPRGVNPGCRLQVRQRDERTVVVVGKPAHQVGEPQPRVAHREVAANRRRKPNRVDDDRPAAVRSAGIEGVETLERDFCAVAGIELEDFRVGGGGGPKRCYASNPMAMISSSRGPRGALITTRSPSRAWCSARAIGESQLTQLRSRSVSSTPTMR